MSFDMASYIMGHTDGEKSGAGEVIIESGITCTDDGEGNVTISEVNN